MREWRELCESVMSLKPHPCLAFGHGIEFPHKTDPLLIMSYVYTGDS